MLKGFFYRRATENNPFQTNIHIRFEINSKESILAEIANLSQEGIQFLLPRGKLILVPDERILLVLNSPEHGEFKIPSDVYYFCNVTDSDNNPSVCYGFKFYELSVSTWEVIQEFCGNQLPDVTFLAYDVNAKAAEKPINRPVIPPGTSAAAPVPNVLSLTGTPATAFMPLTSLPPIIPVEASTAASELTSTSQPKKSNLPGELTPSTSKFPTAAVPDSIVTSVPPLTSSISQGPSAKPSLNSTQALTAAVSGTNQMSKEKKQVKPNLSPIQVLAASLAAPQISHTQTKTQSLSQEMIDRLIEKLQAETDDQQISSTQSALPASNPAFTLPKNATNQHACTPSAGTKVDCKMGEPIVHPNVVHDTAMQPQNCECKSPDGNFQPNASFEPVNFQFGNVKQPDPATKQPDRSAVTAQAATAPFDPFTSFNFQSSQTAPPDIKTGEPVRSEDTPKMRSTPFKNPEKKPTSSTARLGGTSLVDLMSDLDSTINKNVSSVTDKPVAPTEAASNEPILSAKPIKNISLSLEELKKVKLPYSGEKTSHSAPNSQRKSIVPASADIPTSPLPKYSGITSNTPFSQGRPVTSGVKKPPLGSSIIPNTSGVSLDQKAIDKLVDSLIQDMPADETAPVERPSLTKPALSPNSGITVKNGTASKISPPIPSKNARSLSSNTTKVLNMINADHANNRVMDQKSIDMIVKTLTEEEALHPVTPNQAPKQPALVNPIPIKSSATMEPKRTLDQKAIDQVVQALTQNFSTKKNTAASSTATPFIHNKTIPLFNKPTDSPGKDRGATFSLASLSATLQLEKGEVIHATVEQIYVGGLMVSIEQELPLNSSLKLNLFGGSIRITDAVGICTNCEAVSGKTGFLAEIFFKNMTNTHMEQFRTLIAKLEINH